MNQHKNESGEGKTPAPKRRGHRGKTGQLRNSRQLAPSNINRIRVRTKRLTDIDEYKIALAYFLLAKQICEDKSDGHELTEDEVLKLAAEIDGEPTTASKPELEDGLEAA